MTTTHFWKSEDYQMLMTMWNEGKTFAEIQVAMPFILSRSVFDNGVGRARKRGLAMISQSERSALLFHKASPAPAIAMQLEIAVTDANRRREVGNRYKNSPQPAVAASMVGAKPGTTPIDIFALRYGVCRCPVGTTVGEGQMYCGLPTGGKPSYCEYHAHGSAKPLLTGAHVVQQARTERLAALK